MFECCYRKKDICKPFAANSEEKIAFIQFIPFDTWYLSYKQCLSLSKQKALCFFSRKHCLSSSGKNHPRYINYFSHKHYLNLSKKTPVDILLESQALLESIQKKINSTHYFSHKHYRGLSNKPTPQTKTLNFNHIFKLLQWKKEIKTEINKHFTVLCTNHVTYNRKYPKKHP